MYKRQDDGLFLACDSKLKHKAVMRSNLSSAIAGNEGLFNLGIQGDGVVCLESACPKEELVEITLKDDVLKIDGNMAIEMCIRDSLRAIKQHLRLQLKIHFNVMSLIWKTQI